MKIGAQLVLVRQLDQRGRFETRLVAGDLIKHAGGEDKKTAIDETALAGGLFDKSFHPVAIDLQRAEAGGRQDRGDGRLLAVAAVKFYRGGNIEIGNAVAIGEEKIVLALDIGRHALEPTAGQRRLAGVDQRDPPVLGVLLVEVHGIFGHVEGHVRHVQRVVGEIFLDHIALEAAADHEITDAVGVVKLHDVPQDRPAADLHHGLGLDMGFLGEPRPEPAREDYRLHDPRPRARLIPSAKRAATTCTMTGPSVPTPRANPPEMKPGRLGRKGEKAVRLQELMAGRTYRCSVWPEDKRAS